MGIRFNCPNGHKLNVKAFQAGKKGICPYCGTKFVIPIQSTRKSSKEERAALRAIAAASSVLNPLSLNAAPGDTGHMPASPIQMSPPIINLTNAGDDISPLASNFSSQQGVAGTGSTSPILPNAAGSTTNTQKTIPLDKASAASALTRPADPFLTAGDVVWYVRPPSGGQYGPATVNIMRQWLVEGRISTDTLVWREGWRDWQLASVVFPQLQVSDPVAEVSNADDQVGQPISSMVPQTSDSKNPQDMRMMILALIILIFIIFICAVFWFFNRRSPSATDNLTTPSTRLELHDTLSPDRLL